MAHLTDDEDHLLNDEEEDGNKLNISQEVEEFLLKEDGEDEENNDDYADQGQEDEEDENNEDYTDQGQEEEDDVLNLAAEEDLQDEDEYCERKDKFVSEKPVVNSPSAEVESSITERVSVRNTHPRGNIRSNNYQFNNRKIYSPGNNNRFTTNRGNFKRGMHNRGGHRLITRPSNNKQIPLQPSNKVFVNPNFKGVVDVQGSNMRLAYDNSTPNCNINPWMNSVQSQPPPLLGVRTIYDEPPHKMTFEPPPTLDFQPPPPDYQSQHYPIQSWGVPSAFIQGPNSENFTSRPPPLLLSNSYQSPQDSGVFPINTSIPPPWPQRTNWQDNSFNFNPQNSRPNYNNNQSNNRQIYNNEHMFRRFNKNSFTNTNQDQFKVKTVQQEVVTQKKMINQNIAEEPPRKKPKIEDKTQIFDVIQDESEEDRQYRLKIEEQKKERERILKIKEERRKQAILEQQNQCSKSPKDDNLKVSPIPHNLKISPVPQRNSPDFKMNQNQRNFTSNNLKVVQIHRQQPSLSESSSHSNLSQFSSDVENFTFKVKNDLAPPQIVSKQTIVNNTDGFMSNRKVVVKKTIAPKKIAGNSQISGQSTVQNSSFFTDRIVQPKDAMPKTKVVLVNNLSTTTTQSRLMALADGVGQVQSIHLDKGRRQATIIFNDISGAHAFFKKYQRYMLDLSMIQVSLQ